MFAARSQVFDDAKGMIEDGGIVRQSHAAEIAVLAIESPDIEKISGHLVLPNLYSDYHDAVANAVPDRQFFINVVGVAPSN